MLFIMFIFMLIFCIYICCMLNNDYIVVCIIPSVLRHRLLGDRKAIQPVKNLVPAVIKGSFVGKTSGVLPTLE